MATADGTLWFNIIVEGTSWDRGLLTWQAELGRYVFCADLHPDFPEQNEYVYFVKRGGTEQDISSFAPPYELSGSGTPAECRD